MTRYIIGIRKAGFNYVETTEAASREEAKLLWFKAIQGVLYRASDSASIDRRQIFKWVEDAREAFRGRRVTTPWLNGERIEFRIIRIR